jgi:mannose-6-phosphate isomerase-like protein (cupin superfamily)
MRRVVTGHAPNGKAIVVSDTEVDAIVPGSHVLWGADEPSTFPDDGTPPPFSSYFPPVGGFRFGIFTLQPQASGQPTNPKLAERIKVMMERFPDSFKYMEKDHPGFHTTDTIDFEYVLSGEVWLELDDGKEVRLVAGDSVVQNGTRHAWRNKGFEPCRVVWCMIGANRE